MIDRRAVIAAESDRFAEVLAATDPSARVPTCPDWTTVELLGHLTGVHLFWAAVIGRGLGAQQVEEFESTRAPLPEDPDELQQLRRTATSELLAALTGRDPAEEAWSWFPPDQTVGFTWRMQTHEATMHRVDAELAAGLAISPIEPEVAADGVDHAIDVMWAWAPQDAERRVSAAVLLEATDIDRSWLVEIFRWTGEAWGMSFTDQPGLRRVEVAEPTATVRGRAEDLDLLLWTRADRDLARSGDAHGLEELGAVLGGGIQ